MIAHCLVYSDFFANQYSQTLFRHFSKNWTNYACKLGKHNFVIQQWFTFTSNHTSSLTFFRDIDTFLNTRSFFTSRTGRWTAHSCWNYSMCTDFTLLHFGVFIFFLISCSLADWVLCPVFLSLSWRINAELLSFVRKIVGSIHSYYNIQPFLKWLQFMFYARFWWRSHADHNFSN